LLFELLGEGKYARITMNPQLDIWLAPHTARDFVEEVIGEAALYVPGTPNKFKDLCSWADLNRLLEYGGLAYPRVRLVTDSHEIPDEQYSRRGLSGYPRLRVGGVNRALREGGVLIIESIEDLLAPIAACCRVFEAVLELPVQADLYASLKDGAHPFETNDHDLFIIQLDGQRQWRVLSSSVPVMSSGNPIGSAELADWTGVLQPGDLLYLPRRWAFADCHIDGPSLFLGIKFKSPTALDLVRRIFNAVTQNGLLDRDCPRFGEERQANIIHLIQAEWAEACAKPGLILGFAQEARWMYDPHIRFALPGSADPTPASVSEASIVTPLIRFPRRDSAVPIGEQSVAITHEGEMTSFHEDAATILEKVAADSGITVRQLIAESADNIPRERLLTSLCDLAKCGIVFLREPAELDE
jgi:hypothetical protein